MCVRERARSEKTGEKSLLHKRITYIDKEARAAVRAIAHPGDGLGLGEPGARFQAADAVYNTRRHSQYLVSAVAVAFWNASYRSATDKVRDVPPRPRPRSP